MHRFKAKHFPALDGLRGLAILLVIIHHQLIPVSLRGGFLGVDLFFVLSGFLITTLMVMEFDATESISLKNFYFRRVLRLGPALLLYLTLVLAVTWYLNRTEVLHELKLVAFALFYLSNWRMALGWDFSLDSTAITWSLSIEEQFYLIWPLVLFLCLRLRVRRSQVVFGLAFLIVLTMIHRYQLSVGNSDLNRMYYGTDTRADAPLLGCLIALLPSFPLIKLRRDSKKLVGELVGLLPAAAFAFLVITVQFTDQFIYRGGYTLVAVIAGILVWNAANLPNSLVNTLLSWSLLRWFGRISYPLYLCHWLILKTISLYYWFGSGESWAKFFLALSVAALTYYCVERPFMKLKHRYSFVNDATPSSPGVKPTILEPVVGRFNAPLIQTSGNEV